MQMTNEEIVRDYNAAANKSKQIKILAELNAVSPSEIRAVLAQAGVEGVNMPKRIKQNKADAEAQAVDQTVYERIEMILGALPEDATQYTRDTAANLVTAVFRDYVRQRLGTEEKDEP